LAWPEPLWCATLRARAPDIVAEALDQVGPHRLEDLALEPAADGAAVVARARARDQDRTGAAYAVSAALAAVMWSEGMVDDTVPLVVHVDHLVAEVKGRWMAGRRWDLASWRSATRFTIEP
jgi:hypothetical protein